MSDIIRFGVSIEKDLLENYDRLIAEQRLCDASEAPARPYPGGLWSRKSKPNLPRRSGKSNACLLPSRQQSCAEMGEIQHRFHDLVSIRYAPSRFTRRLYGSYRPARRVRQIVNINDLLVSKASSTKLFLTLPSSVIAAK